MEEAVKGKPTRLSEKSIELLQMCEALHDEDIPIGISDSAWGLLYHEACRRYSEKAVNIKLLESLLTAAISTTELRRVLRG